MELSRPRLIEARRLLRATGVIFVSIGDRELPRLRTLMDEVFSESNFLQMLIWQGEGASGNQNSAAGTRLHPHLCSAKDQGSAMEGSTARHSKNSLSTQ